MKFDKLIQIMENRGVEMPTPDIQPVNVDNSLEKKVQDDLSLLRKDAFFDKQLRNIRLKFLEYKKTLNDLRSSYKGRDMVSDRKKLEKQKLNAETAIDSLKTNRKGKLRIVNNAGLPKSEKEQLERELRKLETELTVVKQQLKDRPHSSEIIKLLDKFTKLTDKIETLPPKTTAATREKLDAALYDLKLKLSVPKYQRADYLITKMVREYPRFSKMKTKFSNTNSKPALVKHSKSDIFDLDKKIKAKEKDYEKIMTALNELDSLEHTINTEVEAYNEKAVDSLSTLVRFTADMMLKDSGNLDAGQISKLKELSSSNSSIHQFIDDLFQQYQSYTDENPTQKLRNFGLLPFNELIKILGSK